MANCSSSLAVFKLELLLDPRAVGLDGLDGDVEPAGNVLRVQPAAGQLEDLELAVRQQLGGRGGDGSAWSVRRVMIRLAIFSLR